MSSMTIGRLAQLGDVTPDTIRFYEKLKLVRPLERSRSGYRLYDQQALLRLSFIKRAKLLGFSLEEIKKLLNIDSKRHAHCGEMLDVTNAKLIETRNALRDLTRIRSILTKLTKDCPGGMAPLDHCPILDFLRSSKARPKLKPSR
jgi:MerR family transcriptional regulator, copper efflux regulator